MRTRAKIASVLSSGAVLLIGWQLGTSAGTSDLAAGTATSDTGSAASSGTSGSGASSSGTSSSAASGSASTGSAGSGSSSGSGSSTSDTGSAGGSSPSSGSSGSSGAGDGTYTGESVQTRFGAVQVSVTISGGQITDVTALHLTDAEQRSVQISNSAAPILRQEVLAAQSADVSTVSRATVTSDAYLQSLQSALDEAGW